MQRLSARWVIPCELQQEQILEHHSVIIDQQRIIAILPSEQAAIDYAEAEHIDLKDHALLPGFINLHNHAAMTLFRGMADDLPLMEWLEQHIWPAEGQFVDEAFVNDGTELALLNMIESGTTTFSDMYFFPKVVTELAKSVGIRAQVCCPVIDFPVPGVTSVEQAIQDTVDLHCHYQDDALIDIAFGPHAPYTVSSETLTQVIKQAKAHGIRIQMHIHETAFEVQEYKSKYGKTPIEALSELGLLGSFMQAVHMTSLSDSDIRILKESGTHIIHCPKSNMKLASGICPVDQLLGQGINVALGTDGSASNNSQDILAEAQAASLLAKVSAPSPTSLSAYETLQMLTINAAKALGKHHQIGSLKIDKQADMIAIDLSDAYSQPVYNPVSAIAYSCQSKQVTHSWVAGKLLMNNKKVICLNQAEIINKANAWRDKIRASKSA